MSLRIKFLGHSSFLISFPKANVLTDPFFGEIKQFKRLVPAAAGIKKIEPNIILITHEHSDHYEKETIERIAKRCNAAVIAHDSILQELDLSIALKVPIILNQQKNIRSLRIVALPVHHPNSFYPLSYLISDGNYSVYHAGDTELIDQFSKIKADVALLPIGGHLTMDIIDAVKATKMIKPKIVVPMHYDTFEIIRANPKEFANRIAESTLKTKVAILKPGQEIKI